LNVVNATPTVAFAGGAVVKAISAAAPALTVNVLLGAVEPTSGPAVTVAVKVQDVPNLINKPVKVATPPVVGALVVPPRPHADVMPTVSVVLPLAGVTVKLRSLPAVWGEVMVEKVSVVAADAGDEAANARPASIRAEVAPTATRDFITDLSDRRLSLRFIKLLIRFSAFALPVRFEYLNMCFMGTPSSIGSAQELHPSVVLHLPVNFLGMSWPFMTCTGDRPSIEHSSFLQQLLKSWSSATRIHAA
jgi:hypothetical protein